MTPSAAPFLRQYARALLNHTREDWRPRPLEMSEGELRDGESGHDDSSPVAQGNGLPKNEWMSLTSFLFFAGFRLVLY